MTVFKESGVSERRKMIEDVYAGKPSKLDFPPASINYEDDFCS